ncbi:MAG: hypothetical protein ABEK50_06810 [bacterium]
MERLNKYLSWLFRVAGWIMLFATVVAPLVFYSEGQLNKIRGGICVLIFLLSGVLLVISEILEKVPAMLSNQEELLETIKSQSD